jgi:hypothetical protein
MCVFLSLSLSLCGGKEGDFTNREKFNRGLLGTSERAREARKRHKGTLTATTNYLFFFLFFLSFRWQSFSVYYIQALAG